MAVTDSLKLPEIILTPAATLRWLDQDIPWQEQLFRLGAEQAVKKDPVAAFWRKIASECVNALCHVAVPDAPSEADADSVPHMPLPESFSTWLDSAPPMPGGEYLNRESLKKIWKKLLEWCAESIREEGGLTPFLKEFAPRWEQVGRVFFHLAENKIDNNFPFAFLATYTTGLNERGQPRHAPLARALQQYAGANNVEALARLLMPVHTASKSIPWVREMSKSGHIYGSEAWTPKQAYAFLRSAEEIEACGIGVRLPDWWKKRPRPTINAKVSLGKEGNLSVKKLLEFDINVALGDEQLSEEEIEALLKSGDDSLILIKGQWAEVDSEKLRQALEHWQEVKRAAANGEMDFIQGMRMLAGLDVADKAEVDKEIIQRWSHIDAGPGFKELIDSTRGELNNENQIQIPDLKADLRPYQQHGVSWLRFLGRLGLGACLADDMGLGKTMQILALLLLEKKETSMPTLLIIPASLLGNWKSEAERFAPNLKLALLHPSEMKVDKMDELSKPENLHGYDLVITTYNMCARLNWLADINWQRVIVDEAQNIKNSGTKQSKAVRKLKAAARIALTGTPIENSLSDLWTLFDFLNPGLLGSKTGFAGLVKKLQDSPEKLGPLRKITAPYILRRMKTDKKIIDSLPDKTEVPLYCNLSKEQAKLYAQITAKMERSLQSVDEESNSRRFVVLQHLLLLKQICNHPAQAGSDNVSYDPERSGKFQRVGELCSEIASRQERVLIFTQFREIIPHLSTYMSKVFGRPGLILHGNVPVKKRGDLVDQFQAEDGPPFFIISLKAGGTGLNLTNANHVIHFDRWWNPAVEDQATDRAFRIGQKRNVLVHKCITVGTVEEKINELLLRKKELAEEALGGKEVDITALSNEEILNMVRLDVSRALE